MTGGIAHDFNNSLAVIISGNELIKRRLERGEDATKLIDGISEAAHRAAALTHRLLAFSRQLPLAPETTDGTRLISGMSDMLRRSLGETTQLEVVLAGGLWKTHVDVAQLESSILNLCHQRTGRNARWRPANYRVRKTRISTTNTQELMLT